MSVDLHHMRHFVAVAEELHFGRAAARLGMAQPPLSQSIRRLEEGLGFPLLERTRRKVELTPAGRVFLEEARRTLAQAEDSIRLARRAASEHLAELTVTFASLALYRVLPTALKAHRKRFPNVEIKLDEGATDEQLAGLRDGSADFAFVTPPLKDVADLETRLISRDRFVAAVPTESRFGSLDAVSLRDLAEEDFVLFPYAQGPDLHGRLMAACRRAGFLPRIRQEARRMHPLLSLVSAGMGVSLAPEGARTLQLPGVTFLPLRDAPDDLAWDLAGAWRKRGVRPALRAFIETVASLSQG